MAVVQARSATIQAEWKGTQLSVRKHQLVSSRAEHMNASGQSSCMMLKMEIGERIPEVAVSGKRRVIYG
jgi:hypothetical protein